MQSTLTDRTPNILNKDHPPDKKPKSDKSPVSLKHEFDPTGLVQRCVIIQRDENGFGLTVSGDNPVFVQLVREDGAAMRAGVQTGDRIIKVNGTLVTHSNHIEVVKLIKSGSYVALTVLGRPPGLPHIPLEEEGLRREQEEEQGEACLSSPPPSSPLLSPLLPAREEHSTSPLPPTEDNRALQCQNADSMQRTKEQGDSQTMKEDHSRNPQAKLLKESQEPGRNHHPLLQDQDGGSTGLWSRDGDVEEADTPLTPPWDAGSNGAWSNITGHGSPLPQSFQKEMPSHGPKVTPLDGLICPSAEPQETTDLDSNPQCTVGSPSPRFIPQIIGAEDDYFDAQQEQISGQCSCFQSIESLKSRPAHLAAFLHHVVSQFDPAPLLCYLYADLHKQSSSKETRRLFMDFHSVFLDRAANLKVPVPDSIAAELERRRLDLIPEELCRQYTQQLQDTLLPDLHIKLEDFRQKRSMGLTLAEDMLCKLDADKRKEQSALDKERSCAEHIISKIEDILITSQPTEEEKCATMQYVILTYMKHLGVKVKEPRSLEPKRPRINFLPKMKKSKPEKEGEEKVKKPRFPSILGQPRRPSRVDAPSIGKAMELNKQRSPKQLVSHSAVSIPEHPDASSSRVRGSQSSDGSDSSPHLLPHPASPLPLAQLSEPSGHDSDSGLSPSSALSRLSDGVHSGDNQDSTALPNSPHFDFPCPLEQFQEDVYRMDGLAEVQSEDDQGGGVVYGEDPLNWQRLVSREVLAGLAPLEIKRQEVINELLYTEGAHLRMLRVLDSVFYQRLSRDTVLPPEDIKHIFTNLDQILQLHVSVTEQMTAIRKRSETSVIGPIGNDLLTWFSGEEEEKIKQAVGMFCSNQPSALELIKSRQKKDQRFTSFMQEAESNRQCRRLQLKDMIPMEMQRLAKYPLLLENIAKYTEDSEERSKVKRACECCKKILNHVNQAVKEAENKQRLEEYQRRLDLASLKQSENPMISEFKSLDLTKRKMIHEGPLSWKVNKDKTIELYTLLLEDILVLLQKQDDRLVLKCHSKNLAGNSDTKHIFSPIIKLNTVLVRSVATDNKSFFVLSMSDNGAQIYELMAQTISDQRTWQCLITQCAETMKTKAHTIIPLSQTEAEQDAIEIINTEETKPSKDSDCTSPGCLQPPGIPADGPPSPGLQAPPTNSNNPFEGDEEEEEESAALAEREEEGEERRRREEEGEERRRREEEEEERRRREEEEEVDEAELQAFLDGVLPDSLAFLQETPQEGVTANHQEPHAFHMMPAATRAEEALRTLAVLKQVLLDHMKSREDAGQEETSSRTPGCLLRTVSLGNQNHQNQGTCSVSPDSDTFETGHVSKETEGAELPTGHTGISVATENCGNYMVLDYPGGGCEESNTEDDGVGGGAPWDCEGDSDIDLKKLLSSASQTTEGGGPDLNRQIMTHLRLLQANLQHLKEVETKYNQLRQTRGETATDSDDGSDTIQC